jgi:hypothetical protein
MSSHPSDTSPLSGKIWKYRPPANSTSSRIANRNPGMA